MGCSFIAPIQSALGGVAKAVGSIPGANIVLPIVAASYLGPAAGSLLGATAGSATAAAITGAVGGATAGALSGGGLQGTLTGAALGGAGGYVMGSLLGQASGTPGGGTVGDLASNIQKIHPEISASDAMSLAEQYAKNGFTVAEASSAIMQDAVPGLSPDAAYKFAQAGYSAADIQTMVSKGMTPADLSATASMNFDPASAGSSIGSVLSKIPTSVLNAAGPSGISNLLGSLASGGAALYGAKTASDSASQAAAIQKQSSDAALAEQKRQFDLGQSAQMPWRVAGERALGEQTNLMGLGTQGAEGQLAALMNAPGTQFRLSEGQKALERSAAARGGLFGGSTGKALTEYGQNFATNEYGNRLSQLSSLSGQGQAAASGMAGQGTTYAGNVSNLLTGMGNAGASSSIAQGAAKQAGILGVGQSLSNLFNPPSQQNYLTSLLRG